MKKKIISALTLICAAAVLSSLAGCGGTTKTPASVADGTYTAKSAMREADEDGNGAGYGEVELTVSGNKVVSCQFKTYEPDGTLKDESYGSDMSKENRMKAQKAVQAADKYAEMLTESGTLDGVDAVSGATVNYEEFVEAVNAALQQGAEG